MLTAFRLCELYEVGPAELFIALGTMASCNPEVDGIASFAGHLELALRAFSLNDAEDDAAEPSAQASN